MFQENSIETWILSRVKQITSPGWMHETSARTWCTGRPRGSGWRGRWEGRSGWGTHVNPKEKKKKKWSLKVFIFPDLTLCTKSADHRWSRSRGTFPKLFKSLLCDASYSILRSCCLQNTVWEIQKTLFPKRLPFSFL